MKDEVVGIDAGGTLIKIAYRVNDEWELKKIPLTDMERVQAWIEDRVDNPVIHITGGKAETLRKSLPWPAEPISEFEATCKGVSYLRKRFNEDDTYGNTYIITNVGTGTSIHFAGPEEYERVGGSGMGGGTLIGLSYLLTGIEAYEEILRLGKEGDGRSLNVKVKDIYTDEEPPISGDLTASNFGNIMNMKNNEYENKDYIAAVVRMIGETITTMSVQMADRLNTDSIVYIGSTFDKHDHLKEIIGGYTKLRGKEPCFLPYGEFSGAVGAYMHEQPQIAAKKAEKKG